MRDRAMGVFAHRTRTARQRSEGSRGIANAHHETDREAISFQEASRPRAEGRTPDGDDRLHPSRFKDSASAPGRTAKWDPSGPMLFTTSVNTPLCGSPHCQEHAPQQQADEHRHLCPTRPLWRRAIRAGRSKVRLGRPCQEQIRFVPEGLNRDYRRRAGWPSVVPFAGDHQRRNEIGHGEVHISEPLGAGLCCCERRALWPGSSSPCGRMRTDAVQSKTQPEGRSSVRSTTDDQA